MADEYMDNVSTVLDAVYSEIGINLDASDVHSPQDIAADVVERLIRDFHLTGFNRDDSLREYNGL